MYAAYIVRTLHNNDRQRLGDSPFCSPSQAFQVSFPSCKNDCLKSSSEQYRSYSKAHPAPSITTLEIPHSTYSLYPSAGFNRSDHIRHYALPLRVPSTKWKTRIKDTSTFPNLCQYSKTKEPLHAMDNDLTQTIFPELRQDRNIRAFTAMLQAHLLEV